MARPPLAANAPGLNLVGLVLDGWHVDKQQVRPAGATGGNFSIGYFVTHQASGKKGFLKAIDISREIAAGDPIRLQQMTEIFNFERDLLEICKTSSRIITAISSGSVPAGTIPGTLNSPVFYLIFELAESDARQQVNLRLRLPIGEVFEALHQVAAGLSQLHRLMIAHQDIKPSNILYVDVPTPGASADTRIGDLGRAALSGKVPALYQPLKFMGTAAYTPPELLYGQLSAKPEERHFGCDLYSLGSMAVFFFCGQPTNIFLVNNLDPAHLWRNWHGNYAGVLAYVQAAFAKALVGIRQHVEQYIKPGESDRRKAALNDVMSAIEQLCDPNPAVRGHPAQRGAHANQFDLQRYISLFDKLGRQARAGML